MKIGIYTIHAAPNYGAMLQAFALQKFLSNSGYTSELVNIYTYSDEKRMHFLNDNKSFVNILVNLYSLVSHNIRKKSKRFLEFHNSMNLSQRFFTEKEYTSISSDYDIHLVGSDQVWNIHSGLSINNLYFLNFLDNKKCKIAYAPSMGNYDIPSNLYPQLKDILSSFNALSSREKEGSDLLSKILGKEVKCVIDPVFLLSAEEWDAETDVKPLKKGSYIFYYGFDNSETCKEMLTILKDKLRLPIVAVSSSIKIPYRVNMFCQSAGPRQFINLIRNSSYVITSSFHGTAFSIIYKKGKKFS